jgi:hypothetical protein
MFIGFSFFLFPIISGPEPQQTLLEQSPRKVKEQFCSMLLSAAYGFNHKKLTAYSNERSQNNPAKTSKQTPKNLKTMQPKIPALIK